MEIVVEPFIPPDSSAPGRARAARVGTVAVGASSLWAQVMIVRAALVAFGGNELVVAVLLALWLAAVGFGAFSGGLAAARAGQRLRFILAGTLLLLAFFIYLDFFAARALRGLVGLTAGRCPQVEQIVLGCLLVSFPVSFLVGALFPLLAAWRRAREAGSGEVYGLEAAGSVVAAAVGTYLFLSWGRDDLLVFAAVAVLVFAAYFVLRGRRSGTLCAFALLVWCLLGQLDLFLFKKWGDRYRWSGFTGGFSLLENAETPYGNLAVLGRFGQFQLYFNGRFSFAFPDPFLRLYGLSPVFLQALDPVYRRSAIVQLCPSTCRLTFPGSENYSVSAIKSI